MFPGPSFSYVRFGCVSLASFGRSFLVSFAEFERRISCCMEGTYSCLCLYVFLLGERI